MIRAQTSVRWPSNRGLFLFRLPLRAPATHAPVHAYLKAISKQPPLHFLPASILFADITTFSQYPVCQDYLYLKYAEMKVEALGVYFVIEVAHATACIPIPCLWSLLLDSNSSSRACCCCSSKVRQGPVRTTPSLGDYADLSSVYHRLCQRSLLCKQTLIFIVASLHSHTVLKQNVTRARGGALHCTPCDCRATWGRLV